MVYAQNADANLAKQQFCRFQFPDESRQCMRKVTADTKSPEVLWCYDNRCAYTCESSPCAKDEACKPKYYDPNVRRAVCSILKLDQDCSDLFEQSYTGLVYFCLKTGECIRDYDICEHLHQKTTTTATTKMTTTTTSTTTATTAAPLLQPTTISPLTNKTLDALDALSQGQKILGEKIQELNDEWLNYTLKFSSFEKEEKNQSDMVTHTLELLSDMQKEWNDMEQTLMLTLNATKGGAERAETCLTRKSVADALEDLLSNESFKTCQKGLDLCIEGKETAYKAIEDLTSEKEKLNSELVALKGEISFLELQVGEAEQDRENMADLLKQAKLDYQVCKNESENAKQDWEEKKTKFLTESMALKNMTTKNKILENAMKSCQNRVEKVTDREHDIFNRYNLLFARILSCTRAMYGEEWHRLVCQGEVVPSFLEVINLQKIFLTGRLNLPTFFS